MKQDKTIRVPRELQLRFDNLVRRKSWNNFPSFSREAIRFFLDYQERLENKEK